MLVKLLRFCHLSQHLEFNRLFIYKWVIGTYPSLCVHTLPSLAEFHCDCIGRQVGVLAMQLLSLLLAEMEVSREWLLRELRLQLQQKVGEENTHHVNKIIRNLIDYSA